MKSIMCKLYWTGWQCEASVVGPYPILWLPNPQVQRDCEFFVPDKDSACKWFVISREGGAQSHCMSTCSCEDAHLTLCVDEQLEKL